MLVVMRVSTFDNSTNRACWICLEVELPEGFWGVSVRGIDGALASVVLKAPDLGRREVATLIDPRICVPERAVGLERRVRVDQEKVGQALKPASVVPHRELALVSDAKLIKNVCDPVLES
jgi:hypothetical protein